MGEPDRRLRQFDNVQYLAENMMGRTFCPLGDAAAMPTISFVEKFRPEFEAHLDGKGCPYEGISDVGFRMSGGLRAGSEVVG